MNAFFCDIIGTFDGDYPNRSELLGKFVGILNNICLDLNIEQLTFSFISSNDMDEVLACVKELEPHLKNTRIVLGSQFSYMNEYKDGKIDILPYNSKIDQMRYVYNGKDVKRIFYTDDNVMDQNLSSLLLPKVYKDVELVHLIPNCRDSQIYGDFEYTTSTKGLTGLIEVLEHYYQKVKSDLKHNL